MNAGWRAFVDVSGHAVCAVSVVRDVSEVVIIVPGWQKTVVELDHSTVKADDGVIGVGM